MGKSLIALQRDAAITTESKTRSTVVRQYGTVFRPLFVDRDQEPLIDLSESTPENFFSDFVKYRADPRSKNAITWNMPFLRTLPQQAALRSVDNFMPASRVRGCLNVTDGSNVDDLVDRTCHGYYCHRHIKAFFTYEEEFDYIRNGTDIYPRRLEPPKLQLPMDMPRTEGDKERSSVPLGWRTFAVLALYPTASGVADPSILWSGYRLEDGDPMGRLASGLYKGNFGLLKFTGRDAVLPDNTLMRSKHPIEQGERFRGRKGDMSYLGPEAPRQHETISESLYEKRFSSDGVWPKKHFECVLSSMTALQALWARLSTTMLRSTAKVHRLYKLRVRKNFKHEVFSARRKPDFTGDPEEKKDEPVETSVGVVYFMSAPSLHHAVEFVCSDPMARCNFYERLMLFEADDALKDKVFETREPDRESPRQYLVLGSYDGSKTPELLRDKMMRFIVRSNCVNTHVMLHSPRKDSMVDFRMPLQQFLPITSNQTTRLLGKVPSLMDACRNRNSSLPIADLTIINQFDSDDAFDWARRSPYTRAGCYDSLFVAKAHEIGFYGRNCKYIAPLPMGEASAPLRQEYALIERDPVDVLRKRMSDGLSHVVVLPKVLPRSSGLYQSMSSAKESIFGQESSGTVDSADSRINTESNEKHAESPTDWWPERLLITLRRTVSDSFKSCNISSRYCMSSKRKSTKQKYLGKMPLQFNNELCVEPSLDSIGKVKCGVKSVDMRHPSSMTALQARMLRHGHKVLHVDYELGEPTISGDVQMFPNFLLSPNAIRRLLAENAPIELDRPFYADLLKEYVYISLPAGDFFEFLPGYNNRRFNAMSEGDEHNTGVSAEDMNRLPKNKPLAIGGVWMKKSDCYLLYKSEEERCLLVGKAPHRKDRREPLNADMLKRTLIRNEMYLDYVRKGAFLTWPDLSNAYSYRDKKLITHLSPEEQLRTVWTVPPLNQPNVRYRLCDQLPAARFYNKDNDYSPDDPRYLMSHYPDEVYNMTLEFLEKVDRGEARVEDDPVKALVEAEYILPTQHKDSASTWEEPDVDLLKINEQVPIRDTV
ncbi:hypothetical protein X943_001434 [Babesia divergens]|uniref:Uncharacterized protein n=1 Tax=Babesia divergens TaxID=32595 RepID=A0AAD9LE15_BABDI|nr:hypothetical protein X943_001434 [Babesia divergens]